MILSAQKKIFTLIFILIPIFLFSQNKKAFTVRTDIPPIIDGYLNDSVWNRAIPITDFYQHEPNPLYLPSEKTEVKILYDKNYLYVAFMCYDNESEKIIARELKLDGKWSGDDNVAIIFDTFNDDRNAYWFGTNALGMRDDAILSTGSGFNEEWHGIWDVRSAVVDSGWSCEMIFPFSTFKFSDDDKQIWGINFQRGIKRKGEVVQWTAYEKEHNFFMMSAAGDLIGMENISRGNPIYVKPFFTAGVQTTEAVKEKYVHKPGLDIKYGITEALSLDLTFNTDFAQVESDRARINLTRFPLFFPEKRDFFIEGSSIFNFSIGGSNLFYSRRIGISNGEEIPIIAGTKLVGRLNKMEVGFIDMQTAAKGDEPTTNYGIARLKYDVFDQSYAGVFLSNKISKEGYNRVFAGDFVYSTNKFLGDKNLSIGTGLMKTDETNGSQNSWAGKFYIDYPNDFINQFFTYRFIQENFNPEVGFISRTGIQTWIYNLRISPRINFYQINRLNFIPIESNIDIDKNNELLAGYFTVQPFGFSTIRGDRVSIEIHREFDKV
ncbi:MAG: DUF5916 domain-containing protein, partial [Ignavibacteriaceae bacterium]